MNEYENQVMESDDDYMMTTQTDDVTKMIRILSEDKSFPASLTEKNEFFAFTDKEVVLSNLGERDKSLLINELAIARNMKMMFKPKWSITPEELILVENLEAKFLIKTTRGLQGFERKQLTTNTQIRQNITQSTGQQNKHGFTEKLSRLVPFKQYRMSE